MKYAVFGDVHGNLIALESFLEIVDPVVEGYICTGDIVNYGPWSQECVELISSLKNLTCVQGNHEQILLSGDTSNLSPLVQEFSNISLANFNNINWIKSLPAKTSVFDYELCHTIDNKYIFADTEISLYKSTIIGHSHQQYIRNFQNGTLVNPGSVGQNRKLIDVMEFMLFDVDSNSFEIFSLQYDFDRFINEMIARKYSKRCLEYYMTKERRLP
jgi:putative phosphoesterase